ncbi:antiviral RADAR system adenosine triphosphatase RdrA [Yersinia intermedia]|uniref:antiviral RADAR system adenosine triphosphatase RdrA n=1 Tax=Yersinia intermedia TaxID=631 RepID=UPI0011A3DD04|nr:antiviral RADAR system adenosine triphosphatase RdrA [Yersinia intermedia]
MSGEIILNLELPEYQDNFHSSEDSDEQSGLWQQDANKSLITFLDKMGKEAKHYKQAHAESRKQPTKLSSYHHAIFISGARGTGKTVFLRNAKFVWDNQKKVRFEAPELHFIDVIDPTLLNINDRFSEVIIASVYASVDKKLKLPNIGQERKDSFYTALKTLSGALGQASEFDEFRGIDRIQKYRSGIHIERYFHEFLIASVELLDCDALVLPIDDVDMKIDNAFGVLDDIRCLLSCPLILPLVSGDDDMYRHIATMKFEESLAKNKEASNFNDGKVAAEHLSNAYLTKVFPNHDRLPLVPISQLVSKLKIQYKNRGDDQDDSMMYSDYEQLIKDTFYPLCNGQERSTDWPKPESAREITQLVRLLAPMKLGKFDENKVRLWRDFSVWADEKQDGIALTNAEAFLAISTMQVSDDLDLTKIVAFNSLMQKGRYRWAKKNYYDQQIQCINDLRAHDTNAEIIDTVFTRPSDGVVLKENNIIRSLPPLELIMDPMYISKNLAEEESKNHGLIALYTYHDYYSRQRNRRYHIFFSRAFEILSWSLLAVTDNIPNVFLQENTFKNKLTEIFSRPPFYSIFSLNATKIIDDNDDGNYGFDDPVEYSEAIKSLVDNIYQWYIDNKFSVLKDKNLIPLLSIVFNKVFSQLKVLRSNIVDKKIFKDEHLSDLAKRFEYIFINALTSFVRDGMVINTNVATGARSSSVRSFSEFTRYDRTLSRNISGILKNSDGQTDKITSLIDDDFAILLKVIWCHPIFKMVKGEAYPIGTNRVMNDNEYSELKRKTNFQELKKHYYSKTGYSTIKINEVTDWAVLNPIEAKIMYEKIKTNPSMNQEIHSKGQIAWMFTGLARALGN